MYTRIKKLLITGSTGLVGSRFVDIYKNNFSIITIGRNNVDLYVDLTDQQDILRIVSSSDADAVINFAAYTNVDEAEKEKGDRGGEVYTLNTLLPSRLSKACQESGKKLYHISTDYVFDGAQNDRPYSEKDAPHPVDSWYSQTKCEGELKVLNTFKNKDNFSILRISYPYSGVYDRKLDIARTVINKLNANQIYSGITDQKIKPTSVDDIANALNLLLEKEASGIFHIADNFSPNDYITPYEFAIKIAETFNLDASLISAITFNDFSKERKAPRPQHTWLDTTKIESLGFAASNIDKSLKRMKNQLAI